jgi:peptidoglycan/LPS O-acetylase OafA/YrhL/lysophospholipase L1-like esterase
VAAPSPLTSAPPSATPTTTLARQPALDGLRGLAVALVVAFHAGVPGTGGGYLGVSVFFTLSGFLITWLLIDEHGATGGVRIGAFYARRARRLLPASAATLVGIAVLARFGAWDGVADLRRDLVAGALQVFNWERLAGSGSYADLLAADGGMPSPVEHLWSLSIEEQVYWLWPLAFLVVARRCRARGTSLLGPLAIAAGAAIAVAPLIARTWGPDAAYWATPARLGEVLTGAAAAALASGRGAPTWTRHAALPALGAIVVASSTFPTGRGPAYDGWLPALSIVTAVLLLGLQHDGPATRALAWRPLVALGAISYGVYLVHWPIFTLLDEARLGVDGAALLGARLAATLLVAGACAALIERPIRASRLPTRPSLVVAGAATTLVALAALLVPSRPPATELAGSTVDPEAVAGAAIDPEGPTTPLAIVGAEPSTGSGAGEGTVTTVRPADEGGVGVGPLVTDLAAPTPNRPVRILVFGDSTAEALGAGLARWAAANPTLAQVSILSADGCGFAQGGVRVFADREVEIGPRCDEHVDVRLPDTVGALRPDLVVFVPGGWDIADQRFGDGSPEAPTDATYLARIVAGFDEATTDALDAGAGRVLWLAEPPTDPFWNPVVSPQEDPDRHAALHGTMDALAAADPDRVGVADLAGWIEAVGWTDDRAARPDGVHLSAEAADELAQRWLGPTALAASLRGR